MYICICIWRHNVLNFQFLFYRKRNLGSSQNVEACYVYSRSVKLSHTQDFRRKVIGTCSRPHFSVSYTNDMFTLSHYVVVKYVFFKLNKYINNKNLNILLLILI